MPFSNVEQITPIMQEVIRIKPRSMLDVGCGLGVYGMLSRIQLDLYYDEAFHTKLFREYRAQKRWTGVRIDAIEGFADYADYIPDWVYDDIRIEDVRTALPSIDDGHYDLCIALAIIEHLDKADGLEFIRQLQRIGRTLIIAVPKHVAPQEVVGNPFETHRSTWLKSEFVALGATAFLPHEGAWIAVFDASRPAIQTQPMPLVSVDFDARFSSLENSLGQVLAEQARILAALSVRNRLTSLWKRLSKTAPEPTVPPIDSPANQ